MVRNRGRQGTEGVREGKTELPSANCTTRFYDTQEDLNSIYSFHLLENIYLSNTCSAFTALRVDILLRSDPLRRLTYSNDLANV